MASETSTKPKSPVILLPRQHYPLALTYVVLAGRVNTKSEDRLYIVNCSAADTARATVVHEYMDAHDNQVPVIKQMYGPYIPVELT